MKETYLIVIFLNKKKKNCNFFFILHMSFHFFCFSSRQREFIDPIGVTAVLYTTNAHTDEEQRFIIISRFRNSFIFAIMITGFKKESQKVIGYPWWESGTISCAVTLYSLKKISSNICFCLKDYYGVQVHCTILVFA